MLKTLDEVINELQKLKNKYGGETITVLSDPDTGWWLYFDTINHCNDVIVFGADYCNKMEA